MPKCVACQRQEITEAHRCVCLSKAEITGAHRCVCLSRAEVTEAHRCVCLSMADKRRRIDVCVEGNAIKLIFFTASLGAFLTQHTAS